MKHFIERSINIAIAFAVMFFFYGLIKINVGLSSAQERVQAVGTTVVICVILISLLWVATTFRSKN